MSQTHYPIGWTRYAVQRMGRGAAHNVLLDLVQDALLLTAQGLAAAWQPSALATETGRLQLPARVPADRADVSVDFSDPAGRAFEFQYGVDHGPECDAPCIKWSADNKGCAVPGPVVNVAPELLAMGASLIRTHDSGVLDWPVVFPHSLALQTASSATPDTADPANYNWTQADEYYGRIIESGLQPYFRLGTSWGQLQGGLPPVSVAYNRTALVDLAAHGDALQRRLGRRPQLLKLWSHQVL